MGFLNALYILPSVLFNKHRINLDIVAKGKNLPSIKEVVAIVITFSLTCFAWIFFRSPSLRYAVKYIARICSSSLFTLPVLPKISVIIAVVFFMMIEWFGREQQYALAGIEQKYPKAVRWTFYYCLIAAMVLLTGIDQQFIYFQF